MYALIENITAEDALAYLGDMRYLWVDLRDEEEYRQGHVRNAIHIDVSELIAGHFEKITRRDVILYCTRGGESIRMARILSMEGYRVKNIIGGYREIRKNPAFFIK